MSFGVSALSEFAEEEVIPLGKRFVGIFSYH